MDMQPLQPTLWRTCRILASPTRLNLLRKLFLGNEYSVKALASQTGVSEHLASMHLRAINARGLITARHEGRWVFYSARANPKVDHAATLLAAIRECCRTGMKDPEIIHCATAFTHQRRIRIAMVLQNKNMTISELSIAAQISVPALHRHLRKLIERNMVEREDKQYALRDANTPLGQALLQIATAST